MLLASYHIPFITIFFVIFLAVFTYRIKKTNSDQEEVLKNFWERERQANATRRKDISNLDYINIPQDLFPLNLGTDTENALASLADKPMLNLTGKTNTDLKLEYGLMNLETLSECDNNFSEFVRLVPIYSDELIEADQTDAAEAILEFAVSCKADSRIIFNRLSQIYSDKGQINKIHGLIDSAKSLESLSKNAIIADLNKLIEA